MIAVLDYKGGNLASVSAVLDHLGLAHVVTADPQQVRDAERRYGARYREPSPNPQRVVIEVDVARAMGSADMFG